MANYSLVINSRFKPFSFQEMLAPWQIYGQAYKELENSYGALGVQAGTVESMINKELDRDAYNQYQGYMQGLKESSDTLATQGLNPSLRSSLSNMRTRYGQEIIPIQKAAERREKLAEEQRKLGNSMIFDIDAANTGLNAFMENPSLNYRSIDRKDLYSRAINDFGQIANDLANYEKGKPIDKFTNTFVQDYGITREQAANFVNSIRSGNITGTDPVLKAIYENLYNSTGVSEWNNAQAENTVQNTILEGVSAAVGKSSVSPITNQAAVENARYARELKLYKEKAKIDKEGAEQSAQDAMVRAWDPNIGYLFQGMSTNGDPSSNYAQVRMIDSPTSEAFRTAGLLDENGNITSKGIAVLSSTYEPTSYLVQSGGNVIPWTIPSPEEAQQAVNLGIENKFRETFIREDRIPNVEGTSVSRLNITGDDRDNLERAIKTAIGENGKIYPVGNLDSENRLITSGENPITYSEFNKLIKDGTRVKYIGNNAYTDQLFFQMDDGKWYHMPSPVYSENALNIISQNNRLLQQDNLTDLQEALYGNNIITQLGQPLNNDTGTSMKKNDGTTTFYTYPYQ